VPSTHNHHHHQDGLLADSTAGDVMLPDEAGPNKVKQKSSLLNAIMKVRYSGWSDRAHGWL
jgi:hypothetical protein